MENKNIVLSSGVKDSLTSKLNFLKNTFENITSEVTSIDVVKHIRRISEKIVATRGFNKILYSICESSEVNSYVEELKTSHSPVSILRVKSDCSEMTELSRVSMEGVVFVVYTTEVDEGFILHVDTFIVA